MTKKKTTVVNYRRFFVSIPVVINYRWGVFIISMCF